MFQQQVEYKSFFSPFLCTCRCWEGLFCNADPHLLPVWLPSLLHVLLRLPQQQCKTLLSRGNFLLYHQTTGMKLGKKPQDKTKNTNQSGKMDGWIFLTWWPMGRSPSTLVEMQKKCRKELFGGICWIPWLSWNKLHKIAVKYFSSVPQDTFFVLF